MYSPVRFVIQLGFFFLLLNLGLAIGKQKKEQASYRKMMVAKNAERAAKNNEQFGKFYKAGINKFSHLSHEEFVATHTGYLGDSPRRIQQKARDSEIRKAKGNNNKRNLEELNSTLQSAAQAPYFGPGAVAPRVFYVNWNGTNGTYVTNVKDQGACGSCWAFAGIGELQSYFLWKHQLYLDLSEQQMVDCVPLIESGNLGCGGGYLDSVGDYVTKYPITTEKMYPYLALDSPCSSIKSNTGTFKIRSYSFTRDCNSMALQLINVRPIGVCMMIDTQWSTYKSGVIPSCNVGATSGHCVLLVGAKSDGTSDINNNYWIIRNSWGTDFGEDGFMRLYKDPTDLTQGFCGICNNGIISQ